MLIARFDIENIESFLIEFESNYNFKFPEIYKKFLIKYNGGYTPQTNFKINKLSSDLNGFYGLGHVDEYLSYSVIDDYILKDYVKDQMFPIAENGFGDYLLIGIGLKNNGYIYFLYHDKPKYYIELCKDFSFFIKKCKSEKIGYVETIEERTEWMFSTGQGDEVDDELIKIWQDEIDEYGNMIQEEIILD